MKTKAQLQIIPASPGFACPMGYCWETMSDETMLETIADGPGQNSDPIVAWLTGTVLTETDNGPRLRFILVPITIADASNPADLDVDPSDMTPENCRDIVRPDGRVEWINGTPDWADYVREKCGRRKP